MVCVLLCNYLPSLPLLSVVLGDVALYLTDDLLGALVEEFPAGAVLGQQFLAVGDDRPIHLVHYGRGLCAIQCVSTGFYSPVVGTTQATISIKSFTFDTGNPPQSCFVVAICLTTNSIFNEHLPLLSGISRRFRELMLFFVRLMSPHSRSEKDTHKKHVIQTRLQRGTLFNAKQR